MEYITDSGHLKSYERMKNGEFRVFLCVSKVGELKYAEPDGSTRTEHVTPWELYNLDSVNTVALQSVTLNHPKELLTPYTVKNAEIGKTGQLPVNDFPFLIIPGVVSDIEGIQLLEAATTDGFNVEISAGYTRKKVKASEYKKDRADKGLPTKLDLQDGSAYDLDDVPDDDWVQVGRRYNHVAILKGDQGRAGPDVRVLLDSLNVPIIQQESTVNKNNKPVEGVKPTELLEGVKPTELVEGVKPTEPVNDADPVSTEVAEAILEELAGVSNEYGWGLDLAYKLLMAVTSAFGIDPNLKHDVLEQKVYQALAAMATNQTAVDAMTAELKEYKAEKEAKMMDSLAQEVSRVMAYNTSQGRITTQYYADLSSEMNIEPSPDKFNMVVLKSYGYSGTEVAALGSEALSSLSAFIMKAVPADWKMDEAGNELKALDSKKPASNFAALLDSANISYKQIKQEPNESKDIVSMINNQLDAMRGK